MNQSERMGQESVAKLLWKFSLPAITGMIVQALYNVVDRIYIGNGVGPMGIAGVTIAMPLMLILLAFGMLTGLGATAALSIYLGENRRDKAEAVIGHVMTFSLFGGLALTALGLLFQEPLLKVFGASGETLPYAKTYMTIIFYGITLNGMGFSFNHCIRGEGNPSRAMTTMLLGAGLNIILDPIFIFVFEMGIAGAAWATILSQTISALWVLSYYLNGKSHVRLRLSRMKPNREITKRILTLGSASFAMQLTASGLVGIFNNQLRTYGGDLAITAYGIVNSIGMMILMPIFGLNQGCQPLIGYNFGAKRYDRVKEAVRLAMISATGIVITGFLLCELFPLQIIQIFGVQSGDLLTLGPKALRVVYCMLPVVGFQIIASNYFQATGRPKEALFLSMSRQVVILIPLLLLLPLWLGLPGLFWAVPISDLLSACLTGLLFLVDIRKLPKSSEESLLPLEENQG